jgi:signal transduction histidine kinase
MNNKIKDILTYIDYIFFTGILFFVSIFNVEQLLLIITFAFLFLTSYTLRTNIFYTGKFKFASAASLIFDIALIFALNINDRSFISLALYFFIIEDMVLNFSIRTSGFSTFALFLVYSAALYIMQGFEVSVFVPRGFISLSVFIALYVIFFLIKSLKMQTDVVEEALKDITLKKLEADNLYKNLKEAYEKVEMITLLRERNKVSREIHDTVGHTLTTVLVELEACKRLMNKDTALATEKLSLAQEQVRKGLNDIRVSVRMLEKGEEIMDFYGSLEALIKETELHSEVVIRNKVETSLQLTKEVQALILSAVTEGLANGIRHGKSTAFVIGLHEENESLKFSLQDNGRGSSTLNLGFGLRAMRDRVRALDGSFNISSEKDEGFEINISIPKKKALC